APVVARSLERLYRLVAYHPAPRHLHSFPTRRSSDLSPPPLVPPPLVVPVPPPEGARAAAAPRRRVRAPTAVGARPVTDLRPGSRDRKSTRLNSSHVEISYAVFCLKKKTRTIRCAKAS